MKRKLLFMLLLITGSLCSQNIYLKTGFNNTSYRYTSPSGEQRDDIQSELGNAYEIGYSAPLLYRSRFSYDVGFVLNGYNAVVGVPNVNLKWKTVYAGIQSTILYSIVTVKKFSIDAKAGGGLNAIVYGKEEVNGVVYDLRSNNDFDGAFFHVLLGLQTNLRASSFCHMNIGYNYSSTVNTLKKPQKFSLNTNQIMFGIYFEIK